MVRESLAKHNNESQLTKRFEAIKKRLVLENRLCGVDLPELFTLPTGIDISLFSNEGTSSRMDSESDQKQKLTKETSSKNLQEFNKADQDILKLFYSGNHSKFITEFIQRLNIDPVISTDNKLCDKLARSIRESVSGAIWFFVNITLKNL